MYGFFRVLIIVVLAIFLWPKPYILAPEVGIYPNGIQKCLGISPGGDSSKLERPEGKLCYGWVTPPNDVMHMFKGFIQRDIF